MQRLTERHKFELKETPLIYCFNFCIFVQWAASIELLIMFVLLLLVLKI